MSFQKFQKSPNRLTARDIGFLVFISIVIILTVSALGATSYYFAGSLPDGGEFYLLRTGGRAFLFDRIEPYSGVVPAHVQEQVYGRFALPGEDAYILDIPFHLLIFFFPLALFPDALLARTVWMALSTIGLAVYIYFSFRLLDRRIPIFFAILFFIACFSSFYAYQSLLEGSPVILLGLAFVSILLSLHAGHDELAGALITVSAFQWEINGPILLFIALWVFWERRWRVFSGMAMLVFVLGVISFFLYPGWMLSFMRAAWNSFRMGFGFSLHDVLASLWPDFGSTLGWVLTAILLVVIGVEWRETRGKDFPRFIWTVCITLAATPLLGHRIEMDQFVLLIIPVMLVILISRERWQKLGNGIAFLLLLFFFGVPWLLYTQGVPGGFELSVDETLFVFWPVFSVIGLYWTRWWMLRSPRTWVDRVRQIGK